MRRILSLNSRSRDCDPANSPSANSFANALTREGRSSIPSLVPGARASSRFLEAVGWFDRRGSQSHRTFVAIVRSSLKIAVAKACSVLCPRAWDWVRAIRRIYHSYHARHGFYPSLIFPVRYTEKIQWRKLFDLNPFYPVLCDKLAVRDIVNERVGPEFLVPLLWTGNNPHAIPFEALPAPYIMKSTHGTGHTIIVADRAAQNEPSGKLCVSGSRIATQRRLMKLATSMCHAG